MRFNDHSDIEGHAFLSASKYHWINYPDEKLIDTYRNFQAARKGTELHNFASLCIALGQKLQRSTKTLNLYVNDAIGYRMKPEQTLFYSFNCYGTADAISFRSDLLRIHDLKTGVTNASMTQLEIYAALFCLEYKVPPGSIGMELRIYQNDEVLILNPEVDSIAHIMDRIITFDKYIDKLRAEEND